MLVKYSEDLCTLSMASVITFAEVFDCDACEAVFCLVVDAVVGGRTVVKILVISKPIHDTSQGQYR